MNGKTWYSLTVSKSSSFKEDNTVLKILEMYLIIVFLVKGWYWKRTSKRISFLFCAYSTTYHRMVIWKTMPRCYKKTIGNHEGPACFLLLECSFLTLTK